MNNLMMAGNAYATEKGHAFLIMLSGIWCGYEYVRQPALQRGHLEVAGQRIGVFS